MAAWRHLVGEEAPFATRPDHRVLADPREGAPLLGCQNQLEVPLTKFGATAIAYSSTSWTKNLWCPPGVVSAGMRVRRATARRTVA